MATNIPDLHAVERTARDPNSPYWQGGGRPALRRSVVVFVDILGFTELMRRAHDESEAAALLGRLRSALNTALVNLDLSWAGFTGVMARRQWDYKAFTDNIVIGYPVRHDAEIELVGMLSNLGMFQLSMIEAGFFIRGGVAVGDLYVDRDIVFGTGLLDAVDAEKGPARDPRIILAPSAMAAVASHLETYEHPDSAPHNRELVRDADGQVFINYLDAILIAEDDRGPFIEPLLEHRREVERGLHEHRNNPRIWSKYQWCASYHNYFCSMHPHHFGEEHQIDLASFNPVMARLVE